MLACRSVRVGDSPLNQPPFCTQSWAILTKPGWQRCLPNHADEGNERNVPETNRILRPWDVGASMAHVGMLVI